MQFDIIAEDVDGGEALLVENDEVRGLKGILKRISKKKNKLRSEVNL